MSRLSDLEEVYDELVAINFDFTTLPATSKYRLYYEWRTDPTKRQIPESSIEPRLADKRVGIKFFGLPDGTDNQILVRMSGRSYNFVSADTSFGSLDTIYGIESTTLDGYFSRSGYTPAKVIAGKTLTAPTAETSGITGKKYKRRVENNYTVPFGRVGATSTEFERQEAIIAQLASGWSVTFKPEKLVRKR